MSAEQVERMAVNAAIEKLIARDDESGEAARILIAYGSKLKSFGKVQANYSRYTKSSGDSVSGHTPRQGEVTVEDGEREQHREWTYGTDKDRVGHYRLWKQREGVLKFHHFWKSSTATKGMNDKDPDEYQLGYNCQSLEPLYFGIRREKILFSFRLGLSIKVARLYLEFIYGHADDLGSGIGITITN